MINGSEIHFESVKNIDSCVLATESALTQSVRLYGLPGHIPTLWHSKGITNGLLTINVLGKKDFKVEILLIWNQNWPTKSKTRTTNLRAGPNRTLNRSSESERIFHESIWFWIKSSWITPETSKTLALF